MNRHLSPSPSSTSKWLIPVLIVGAAAATVVIRTITIVMPTPATKAESRDQAEVAEKVAQLAGKIFS